MGLGHNFGQTQLVRTADQRPRGERCDRDYDQGRPTDRLISRAVISTSWTASRVDLSSGAPSSGIVMQRELSLAESEVVSVGSGNVVGARTAPLHDGKVGLHGFQTSRRVMHPGIHQGDGGAAIEAP